MAGSNGGGAFVFIYIVCLLILGLPALTMEFAIGRAAQASPVKMYRKLEKRDRNGISTDILLLREMYA